MVNKQSFSTNKLGAAGLRVNNVERISIRVTKWIGTPWSIIIHTFLFGFIFSLKFFGVRIEDILLILTTAVSLEAIYLAIFIQMTVNRNTAALEAVEDDLEDIQEDVEDLGEDVFRLDGKYSGLVYFTPTLVGAPNSGLVLCKV